MTYLIFRSQTEALKASRVLAGAGIHGVLTKPPRGEQTHSCTYAVRIADKDLYMAQRRFQETNFIPCKVRILSN